METVYDSFALIRPTGNREVEMSLLFRFYDDQGIQVGTCTSDVVRIEPDIGQRFTCAVPLIVDTASLQPSIVRVESLPVEN